MNFSRLSRAVGLSVLLAASGACAGSRATTADDLLNAKKLFGAPANKEFKISRWAKRNGFERWYAYRYGSIYSTPELKDSIFSRVDFVVPSFWTSARVGLLRTPIDLDQAKQLHGLEPKSTFAYGVENDPQRRAAQPWRGWTWIETDQKGVMLLLDPEASPPKVTALARVYIPDDVLHITRMFSFERALEEIDMATVTGSLRPVGQDLVSQMLSDPTSAAEDALHGLRVRMQLEWLAWLGDVGVALNGQTNAEMVALLAQRMGDRAPAACAVLPESCATFLRTTATDIAEMTNGEDAASRLHADMQGLHERLQVSGASRTMWPEVSEALRVGALEWTVVGELSAAGQGLRSVDEATRIYRRSVEAPKDLPVEMFPTLRAGVNKLRGHLITANREAAHAAAAKGMHNTAIAHWLRAQVLEGASGQQSTPAGLTDSLGTAMARFAPGIALPASAGVNIGDLFAGLGISTLLTNYSGIGVSLLQAPNPALTLTVEKPFTVALGVSIIRETSKTKAYTRGRYVPNPAYPRYMAQRSRLLAEVTKLEASVAASSKAELKQTVQTYRSARVMKIGHDTYKVTRTQTYVRPEIDHAQRAKTGSMRYRLDSARSALRGLDEPSQSIRIEDNLSFSYTTSVKHWPGQATRSFSIRGAHGTSKVEQRVDVASFEFVRQDGSADAKVPSLNEWPANEAELKKLLRRQLDEQAGEQTRALYRGFQLAAIERFEAEAKTKGWTAQEQELELQWARYLWLGETNARLRGLDPAEQETLRGDPWANSASVMIAVSNYDPKGATEDVTKENGSVSHGVRCITEDGAYSISTQGIVDVAAGEKVGGPYPSICVPGARYLFSDSGYELFDLHVGVGRTLKESPKRERERKRESWTSIAFSADGRYVMGITDTYNVNWDVMVVDLVEGREVYVHPMRHGGKGRSVDFLQINPITRQVEFEHDEKRYRGTFDTMDTVEL